MGKSTISINHAVFMKYKSISINELNENKMLLLSIFFLFVALWNMVHVTRVPVILEMLMFAYCVVQKIKDE